MGLQETYAVRQDDGVRVLWSDWPQYLRQEDSRIWNWAVPLEQPHFRWSKRRVRQNSPCASVSNHYCFRVFASASRNTYHEGALNSLRYDQSDQWRLSPVSFQTLIFCRSKGEEPKEYFESLRHQTQLRAELEVKYQTAYNEARNIDQECKKALSVSVMGDNEELTPLIKLYQKYYVYYDKIRPKQPRFHEPIQPVIKQKEKSDDEDDEHDSKSD